MKQIIQILQIISFSQEQVIILKFDKLHGFFFSTLKIKYLHQYNRKQPVALIPLLGFEHSNTPMVYMQPYKPWIYVFSIIHANKNFPRL